MKPNLPDKPQRPGVLKIVLYMILMGIVVGWAAFFVMPTAIAWEIAPSTVNRFPTVGFLLGAALGLAMGFSEPMRHFVWLVFGAIVAGWLVWLFIVTLVGLGLSFSGVDEEAFDEVMDWISPVAFWISIISAGAIIAVGAFAIAYDKTDAMLERFRPKSR